jgi:hypothetical protein
MNTRLITPDGFPRADLDVAQSMCGLLPEPTNLLKLKQFEPRGPA